MSLLESGTPAQRLWGKTEGTDKLTPEILQTVADPPDGVCRKRHSGLGIETGQRAQQPDRSLLDKVLPLNPRRPIRSGKPYDEREQSIDELFARSCIARLGSTHQVWLYLSPAGFFKRVPLEQGTWRTVSR